MQLWIHVEKIQNQLDKECIRIRPFCYPGSSTFCKKFYFFSRELSTSVHFFWEKGQLNCSGIIILDFNSTVNIYLKKTLTEHYDVPAFARSLQFCRLLPRRRPRAWPSCSRGTSTSAGCTRSCRAAGTRSRWCWRSSPGPSSQLLLSPCSGCCRRSDVARKEPAVSSCLDPFASAAGWCPGSLWVVCLSNYQDPDLNRMYSAGDEKLSSVFVKTMRWFIFLFLFLPSMLNVVHHLSLSLLLKHKFCVSSVVVVYICVFLPHVFNNHKQDKMNFTVCICNQLCNHHECFLLNRASSLACSARDQLGLARFNFVTSWTSISARFVNEPARTEQKPAREFERANICQQTKPPHAHATLKHMRNSIASLTDDNGTNFSEHDHKADLMWNAFRSRNF